MPASTTSIAGTSPISTATQVNARGSKSSICFVAPGAYGAISGREDIAQIGGAEIQQMLVARELVKRGYHVRFVTRDHGQPDGVDHDGIQVYKMCGRDSGLPGVRFLHPRWTSLVAAMRRAKSDIYYQRAAGVETGQVALWCRKKRRGFVFAAAVDDDCRQSLPLLKRDLRAKMLFRYGLRSADAVIAQTERQVTLLKESFGVEAILIRSCGDASLSGNCQHQALSEYGTPIVLWVGRLAEQKRPDRLLDLAEICGDIHFDMIGASNTRSAYAEGVLARAKSISNVTVSGWIPRSQMFKYYDRATMLVCTSASEGFPNVFLESWARGLPTVSMVDPDGVIEQNGLGAVGSTVTELANHVRRLAENPSARKECAVRTCQFFVNHHSVGVCVDAYESLFDGVLRRSASR